MAELHDKTALELAQLVAQREVSTEQLAQYFLDRIQQLNPQLGALTYVDHELKYLGSAGELSALAGVPFVAKGLSSVTAWPYDEGSLVFKDRIAQATHSFVAGVMGAGLSCIGLTNVPEFGMAAYTDSLVHPPARTPWNLDYCAGGSSGGAAAAVAAKLVPIALGSDAAGSIRIPASVNGVVGYKPSRNLGNGRFADAKSSLLVQGVITRTIPDAAAFLDALMPSASSSFGEALRHPTESLSIGVTTANIYEAAVHVDCEAALGAAISALEAAGHRIKKVELPPCDGVAQAFLDLWAAGSLERNFTADEERQLTPLLRHLRSAGRKLGNELICRHRLTIEAFAAKFLEVTAGYDAIVTPTLAQPPRKVGALRNDAEPEQDIADQCTFSPFAVVSNFTGQPAVSLPLSRNASAQPIGIQLAAHPGDDRKLLELAYQLELTMGFACSV
jgi:amidase